MIPHREGRWRRTGRTLLAALGLMLGGGRDGRAQEPAQALSAQFRSAARRVLPAVVTVRTSAAEESGENRPAAAGGSGIVVDAQAGLILTNSHVAGEGAPVLVGLPDGRERPVLEIHRDPRSDLAILRIEPEGLVAAAWGDAAALDLGDWVLAIGQPFGLPGTVTAGIVSATARGYGGSPYEDLIQTDAAINPGNSGGPLVNLKGEVVGVNIAIKTRGGGYEGVGFAVPAERARRVASDLAVHGHVQRATIGVQVARRDPSQLPTEGHAGAVAVTAVTPLGPAADSGLGVGDWIIELDGRPTRGVGALLAAVESWPIGEPLRLRISRDGATRSIVVRPARAETAGPAAEERTRPPVPVAPASGSIRAADATRNPTRFPELGLRLAEATPPPTEPGPRPGLLVRGIEPGGPADQAGLEIGMGVTHAGGQAVATLADFRAALASRADRRDLVLRVRKGDKAEFRVILAESIRGSRPPQ